jgi:hypothetical protein
MVALQISQIGRTLNSLSRDRRSRSTIEGHVPGGGVSGDPSILLVRRVVVRAREC